MVEELLNRGSKDGDPWYTVARHLVKCKSWKAGLVPSTLVAVEEVARKQIRICWLLLVAFREDLQEKDILKRELIDLQAKMKENGKSIEKSHFVELKKLTALNHKQ